MAYRAEIQIGVVGIGQLGALQKTLNQVSNAVDLINSKQVKAGFNIRNINTYNAQLEKAWKNINKAALGSQEELVAVRSLVQAKNNQIAAQERLNKLIEREELTQRKIVATANAGFGVQGPAVPPKPAAGITSNASLNAILGGAFPALFGAGPGAILGGVAGGAIGGQMGGLGGMALSVALSAVGQQLDQIVVKLRDIGNATQALDIAKLSESAIFVNAELSNTVELLADAGRTAEARAAIETEIARQTGLSSASQRRVTEETNRLTNSWNGLYATVSATVAEISIDFIRGLTGAIVLVQRINKTVNEILPNIRAIANFLVSQLPGANILKLFVDLAKLVPTITENAEARNVTLGKTLKSQERDITNNKELLRIERGRTLGRTLAEQAINLSVEKRLSTEKINQEYAAKARDLLRENVGLEQSKLNELLKNNETLKTQAIEQLRVKDLLTEQNLQIELSKEKYQQAAEAVQRQREALERSNAVTQSRLSAEAALNDLYGAQLQRQYELATTAQQRFNIAIKQFYQQVAAADIEYRQAKANNELLLQKAQLEYKLVEIKYKQIEAEKALGVAQAIARGNTSEQVQAISAAYDKALAVQVEIIQASRDQISATAQIAKNQDQIAAAVYQTKLIQAESQLAQRLTSKEIGLSKQSADRLAGSLSIGVMQASKMQSALYGVSTAAANAAANIARATGQSYVVTQRTEQSTATGKVMTAQYQYADGTRGYSYIKAHYAKGGYVSSPTVAMIGEGGQGEYVVPESKAAAFAMNYMLGARGTGAIDGIVAPPAINITTGPVMQQGGQNYVTIQDMEAGLQAVADTILSNSRSYSARRFTGVL